MVSATNHQQSVEWFQDQEIEGGISAKRDVLAGRVFPGSGGIVGCVCVEVSSCWVEIASAEWFQRFSADGCLEVESGVEQRKIAETRAIARWVSLASFDCS